MSAISTTGARIVRLDNVHPARPRHLRLIGAVKLEKSSPYLCLEASITSISRPHDLPDRFFAPARSDAVDTNPLPQRRACLSASHAVTIIRDDQMQPIVGTSQLDENIVALA